MYGRPEISEYWIKCEECGKKFRKLTHFHLEKHNLSVPEYKKKWGLCNNQPLECLLTHDVRSEKVKKNGTIKNIKKDNGHRFLKGIKNLKRKWNIMREQEKIRVREQGKRIGKIYGGQFKDLSIEEQKEREKYFDKIEDNFYKRLQKEFRV